jgi:DNA-binding IclR family transcriptional regulator
VISQAKSRFSLGDRFLNVGDRLLNVNDVRSQFDNHSDKEQHEETGKEIKYADNYCSI